MFQVEDLGRPLQLSNNGISLSIQVKKEHIGTSQFKQVSEMESRMGLCYFPNCSTLIIAEWNL